MLAFVIAALLIAGVILLILGQGTPALACLIIGAILAVVWIGIFLAGRRGPRVPPV